VRSLVGFDETGNTGPDLLQRDQPLYVLAAVRLTDEEASEVLRSDLERHFVRDKRSNAGRRRVIESLSSSLLTADTVRYSIVHKPFSATAKMIDLLVEPVLADAGVDMYADGMHLGAANLLHLVMSTFDVTRFEAMQAAFVAMCRQRTQRSVDTFYAAASDFERAARERAGRDDPILGAVLLSRSLAEQVFVGPRENPLAPSDLDPAVTCLIALIHDWVRAVGPIIIEHDDSKEVRRSLDVVRRLWRKSPDSVTLSLWNAEELTYPLHVDDFDFATSTESGRVQVADLIAGAAMEVHALVLGRPETEFTTRLQDLPWDAWRSNASVWPSLEDITPNRPRPQSQTPWPADAMADWLR
jgi:hypothetical protein